MDFFISHIGWFVGIFFICLFAVVGYYAEKKEQNEAEKNKLDDNKDIVENKIDNNTFDSTQTEPTIEHISGDYNHENQNTEINDASESLFNSDFIYEKEDNIESQDNSIDYNINVDGSNDTSNLKSEFSGLEWDGIEDNDSLNSPLVNDINPVDNNIDNTTVMTDTNELNNSFNITENESLNADVNPDMNIDNNINEDNLNANPFNNNTNNMNEINEINNISDGILSSNIVTDGFSTIEDVNMTLDDLENKDEIDVTNDSLGVTTSDNGLIDDYDNEYESENEVFDNDNSSDQIDSLEIPDSIEDSNNTLENSYDNEKDIIISKDNISNTTSSITPNYDADNFEQNIDNSKMDENTRNLDDEDTDEIINRIVFSDEVEEPNENHEDNNIENSIDLYNNSTSDDIWKF